jgi:hypothetical protein
MLEDFTVATFSGRIGQAFRVHAEAATLEMELRSATEAHRRDGEAPARQGARTPFSLVFRGPLEPVLPQRIYRFETGGLGEFELFIVPIGPDESGMQYEAVFG